MTEDQVEDAVKAKGLTGQRVTREQIDTLTQSMMTMTHRFPGTTCTVAVAILPNGFVAGIGKSAAVDPANFDAEIGMRVAIDNAHKDARDRLWELEGYALKKKITATQ
jgi:membrane protein involved in colicin uptake